MKNSNPALATLLALTGSAVGQINTCDGNQAPNWDDCDAIYAVSRGGVDFVPNFFPTCYLYPVPDGVDPDSLNCQIVWCYDSAENLDTFSSADGDYTLLTQTCEPQNAGGGAGREGSYTLQVTNNPNYNINAKRAAEARSEDYIGGSASRPRKRQAENDTGFTLVTSSRSVEREGVQIIGGLPSGSMYMVTQEDSKTTGVSISASVGASFLEFFSAEIGTEVSMETTSSNAVGITVNIPCDVGQRGQIFWYPLYDVYSGFTTPSNTNVEVAVPQEGGLSSSNYRVVCLEG